MKSSAIFSSIAILLIGAFVLAEASARYNQPGPNYPVRADGYRPNNGGHMMSGHGNGCRGYQCQPRSYYPHNQMRYPAAHGSYSQHMVRPAVYGGRGLYNYRGYARNTAPAPRYRQTRSCNGYNCNSSRNHNALRPVNALVMSKNYNQVHAYSQKAFIPAYPTYLNQASYNGNGNGNGAASSHRYRSNQSHGRYTGRQSGGRANGGY